MIPDVIHKIVLHEEDVGDIDHRHLSHHQISEGHGEPK